MYMYLDLGRCVDGIREFAHKSNTCRPHVKALQYEHPRSGPRVSKTTCVNCNGEKHVHVSVTIVVQGVVYARIFGRILLLVLK